uniref:Uncharacterized protein n=1 Tax=Ditylenchus dipsaci TaxID=166011 RepID=A0A915EBM1_9BILA
MSIFERLRELVHRNDRKVAGETDKKAAADKDEPTKANVNASANNAVHSDTRVIQPGPDARLSPELEKFTTKNALELAGIGAVTLTALIVARKALRR